MRQVQLKTLMPANTVAPGGARGCRPLPRRVAALVSVLILLFPVVARVETKQQRDVTQ
jgi:hypothetical protein